MQVDWYTLAWGFIGLCLGVALTVLTIRARATLAGKNSGRENPIQALAAKILNELEMFAVILDRSYSVVFANREAIEQGSVPAELVTTEEFIDIVKTVFAEHESFTRFEDDDPEGIWVHVFPLSEDFVVVLAEDRGEEMRLNAVRRDFIANMSHELKTPVSSLGLLAEAIKAAGSDPDRVGEFADSMVHESRRLGALTNDIILLSEAQSEPRPEDLMSVDVFELVQREVDELRAYAENRDVELSYVSKVEPGHTSETIGRPKALGTAVANLLTNAIKHSPPQARVGIVVTKEDDWIIVRVTDQGEGIEQDNLERIFERFYRIDNARTRAEGGTGLGLSIVRHTMLSHGGSVDVWSKPGVGSTFSLKLPVVGSGLTADKLLKKKRKKREKS